MNVFLKHFDINSRIFFQVSHCLHEILDQCGAFSKLLMHCESPMVHRELNQLESIAKVSICILFQFTSQIGYFEPNW